MAADEALYDGMFDYKPNKVRKFNGYIYGASGSIPSDIALDEWLFQLATNKRAKKEDYAFNRVGSMPPYNAKSKFEILLVTPDKKMYNINARGSVWPVYSKFWALGSGKEVCMGAMMAGATAAEAVKYAIELCDGCKGKVRTVKL